jgi:hypothetical protein
MVTGGQSPEMTIQTFCKSGEQEEVKGVVHAIAGLLAVAMATYNMTAWFYRRQAHLGINTVVYSIVVAWELKQTLHHLRRPICESLPNAA